MNSTKWDWLGTAKGREVQVTAELSESKVIEARLAGLVAELKLSEHRNARETARLQAILKTASDGIHVISAKNGNLFARRVVPEDRLLGYEEADIPILGVADWDRFVLRRHVQPNQEL